MRSTQELREEIFRRAEHKKRATRALYRRMGTLCLLLCLCAGVTVWGMLGQTAPEQSLSTESTVSLQQTLQGDPSLPHEEEYSAEENSAEENSVRPEEPSETVYDPYMDEVVSDESPPEDELLPEENLPEAAPPEEAPLPTVMLLNGNIGPYDSVMFYYTMQGMLTEEETVLAPGDTVEVEFPDKVILYGCDSVLAAGEWKDGVFVVTDAFDCLLFADPAAEEDYPDGDDETELPSDGNDSWGDEGFDISSKLYTLLERIGEDSIRPDKTGEELLDALRVLYE